MNPENGGISGIYKRPDSFVGRVEEQRAYAVIDLIGYDRKLADLTRSHTKVTNIKDTIARHNNNMQNLMKRLNPGRSVELIDAIQDHDAAELLLGDTPSPAKKAFPELKEMLDALENYVNRWLQIKIKLTPEEKNWLKSVDKLEYLMSCIDEAELGNTRVLPLIDKYRQWFKDTPDIPKPVKDAADTYAMRKTITLEQMR